MVYTFILVSVCNTLSGLVGFLAGIFLTLSKSSKQLKDKEKQIKLLQDQLNTSKKEIVGCANLKDDAYHERNMCVAGIAKLASKLGYRVGKTWHGCDPTWDPDWMNIVVIELPTGVVTWHVRDSEIHMFSEFPSVWPDYKYDGHTTEEKYKRLLAIGDSHEHN